MLVSYQTNQTGGGARVMSELISSCYRAEERFRSAAANSEDWTLKRLFEIYAQQRTRFAEELREHLPATEGEAIGQGGDPLSETEWGSSSDNSVADCLESDSRTLQLYRKALATREIPTRTQFLIASQLALLERAHERVTGLVHRPDAGTRAPAAAAGRARA